MPKKDARTLVARFNEQIEPIYVLLRETEDVNLSHELLEPEPTEIPALKQRLSPPPPFLFFFFFSPPATCSLIGLSVWVVCLREGTGLWWTQVTVNRSLVNAL